MRNSYQTVADVLSSPVQSRPFIPGYKTFKFQTLTMPSVKGCDLSFLIKFALFGYTIWWDTVFAGLNCCRSAFSLCCIKFENDFSVFLINQPQEYD